MIEDSQTDHPDCAAVPGVDALAPHPSRSLGLLRHGPANNRRALSRCAGIAALAQT